MKTNIEIFNFNIRETYNILIWSDDLNILIICN